MAFTMSYSIDPPDAPKAKSPAAKTVKAKAQPRARKVNDNLAQAQALFQPAPARAAETPEPADMKPESDTTA